MLMTPSGPQSTDDLIFGDYVRLLSQRFGPNKHGIDEGFVRIESVEHIPGTRAAQVFSYQYIDGLGPVAVAWCHGAPGPIVLRAGDVRMLDSVNPGRLAHDCEDPSWKKVPDPLLRGGQRAGLHPRPKRRQPSDRGSIEWATTASPQRASHRASAFTKPAWALIVGDYVQVCANRWPPQDVDTDEGFARVEHVDVVDAEVAESVFDDPTWHTMVFVVTVNSLPGVLLLRREDDISVMTYVNPEREAWDKRNPWFEEPLFIVAGSRGPTSNELSAASAADQRLRPAVSEADRYVSSFADEADRRFVLDSVSGVRIVPLAALPWPHNQARCPLADLVEQEVGAHPDSKAAHAAAFTSDAGARAQQTCPYHRPDWPKLVRILEESIDLASDDPHVEQHPDYGDLSDEEREWLYTLIVEPLIWDDNDSHLTNGQHRLCALRGAGIERAPVDGSYLPDTDYGGPCSAPDDAQQTIAACWDRYAADRGWPVWVGRRASKLPRRWRVRFLKLFPPVPR
jgi:hypothetical protein